MEDTAFFTAGSGLALTLGLMDGDIPTLAILTLTATYITYMILYIQVRVSHLVL
jgi:hypothetical protein